jgi:site-specific DNA-methyltransferase (adenine-specific)
MTSNNETKCDHRIIVGCAKEELSDLDSESVDLVVTSPPYWQIKDYEADGQIGADQSYDEYLDDLCTVWEECHRVLKPGCRMAINIGDQYLRASEHGRYRVKPIPADNVQMCQDIGFDFMGNIIWRKVSTTNTTGGCSWMGSIYYPKDGHVTYEHEYICLFRKRGDWEKPSEEAKEKSRLTKEQRSRWFRGYWELSPETQDDHLAKFPVELPHRLIKMYTFHGETVIDPFLGSGTTTLAAQKNGRDSIGIELNPDYVPLIRDKLDIKDDLFGDTTRENGKLKFSGERTNVVIENIPEEAQKTSS